MKKIITYGTFDLLHHGHINILQKAKDLGDFLIVGLSTDEFNQQKNKQAALTFEQRKIVLEALQCVDLIIPESNWEQKENDIKEYDIDVFVMGDDWKGEFDFLSKFCEVTYLPRTKNISTTAIKNCVKENHV